MARQFSSQYLDGLRFPRLPTLHARLRAQRLIGSARWALRRFDGGRPQRMPAPEAGERIFSDALEAAQADLRNRGWAFVRDVLDRDFHQRLRAEWPRRRYFRPASSLVKSWDRGFDWKRGQSREPADLERHPILRRLLDELRCEQFGHRFSRLVGKPEVSCYSFVATMTVPGSVVAPHRDDWAFIQGLRAAYNMVLFIAGTGGPRSGGLSILGSNDFQQVLFESQELENTALVYDTTAEFFHGFQPVARGKHRWAVITNFVADEYGREPEPAAADGNGQAQDL